MSSLWAEVNENNLQIPDPLLGYRDHDKPLGTGKSIWHDFRGRGYLPNHAIAAVKSYLYIPRKYRVKRSRFHEKIGHPLFYYDQAARHIGPLHGPWYINRFNRQIVYGEENKEGNFIQPDPMLGFASKHPMLWGEEHLR